MLAALARVLLNKDGDGLRGRRRRLYLDDGVGEDEDAAARDTSARRARAAAASAVHPSTLLATAAAAAVAAWPRWSAATLSSLPPDLADILLSTLLATGAADTASIRLLAAGGDQPLSSLPFSRAPGACDAWLAAVPPGRLVSVCLDGCAAITDAGLATLARHAATLRCLSARRLRCATDGGLAAALGGMGELREVSLDGTDARRATVAALARLPRLTSASLAACWSADGAAAALASGPAAANLVVLDLSGVRSSDDAAAKTLALRSLSLTRLSLAGSFVGDDGVAALAACLPRLADFSVAGCGRVGGKGAQALAAATALTRLDVSRTGRAPDAALAELAALPRLADLNASFTAAGNGAAGAWAGGRAGETLRVLSLDSTALADTGVAALATLPSLTRLSLADCDAVTDAGVACLAGAPALADLDVSFTRSGDAALSALAACSSLTRLAFDSPTATDAGVGALVAGASTRRGRARGVARPPPLAAVDAGVSRVGDAGLAALATLTTLTSLDIASGLVTDAGLATLASRAPSLARLGVPRSLGVSDVGVARLASTGRLTSLDVAGTSLTSAGVSTLASLRGLRHLVTRGSRARPAAVAAELPLLTEVKS